MDGSDNPNIKIKFSSDNIDEYEKQFMLEHDKAPSNNIAPTHGIISCMDQTKSNG